MKRSAYFNCSASEMALGAVNGAASGGHCAALAGSKDPKMSTRARRSIAARGKTILYSACTNGYGFTSGSLTVFHAQPATHAEDSR